MKKKIDKTMIISGKFRPVPCLELEVKLVFFYLIDDA